MDRKGSGSSAGHGSSGSAGFGGGAAAGVFGAPSDWVALHARARFVRHCYLEELRAENDAVARVALLNVLQHRQVRHAKYLAGWVQFLRTGRSHAMDRNEWGSGGGSGSGSGGAASDAPNELFAASGVGSLSEPALERVDAFVRLLRARPDVLAVMALAALDPITAASTKLKHVLGLGAGAGGAGSGGVNGSDKYVFSELLVYSLFGSASARDETNNSAGGFRTFFRALLAAEFRFESTPAFVTASHRAVKEQTLAALHGGGVTGVGTTTPMAVTISPTAGASPSHAALAARSPTASSSASSSAAAGVASPPTVPMSLPAHVMAQSVTLESLSSSDTDSAFVGAGSMMDSSSAPWLSAGGGPVATRQPSPSVVVAPTATRGTPSAGLMMTGSKPHAVQQQQQRRGATAEAPTSVTNATEFFQRARKVPRVPMRTLVTRLWLRRFASDFIARTFQLPMRALLQESVYFVDPDTVPDATNAGSDDGSLAASPNPAARKGDAKTNSKPAELVKAKTSANLFSFDRKPTASASSSSSAAAAAASPDKYASQPGTSAGSAASPPPSGSVTPSNAASPHVAVFGGSSGAAQQQQQQQRRVRDKVVRRVVDAFVNKIIRATQRWPWQVLHLMSDILAFARTQWPGTAQYAAQRHHLVTSTLFSGLLLPALRKPALAGLYEAGGTLTRLQRWNVSVVVSILQAILSPGQLSATAAPSAGSGTPGGSGSGSGSASASASSTPPQRVPFPEPHYLSVFNGFVMEHARRVRHSIEVLTASIEAIPPPAPVLGAGSANGTEPHLHPTGGLPPSTAFTNTVCLTLAEVHFLHRLLYQHHQSSHTAAFSLQSLPHYKTDIAPYATMPIGALPAAAAAASAMSGITGSASVAAGTTAAASDAAAAATDSVSGTAGGLSTAPGMARHFLIPIGDDKERWQPAFPDMEKRLTKLVLARYQAAVAALTASQAAAAAAAAAAASPATTTVIPTEPVSPSPSPSPAPAAQSPLQLGASGSSSSLSALVHTPTSAGATRSADAANRSGSAGQPYSASPAATPPLPVSALSAAVSDTPSLPLGGDSKVEAPKSNPKAAAPATGRVSDAKESVATTTATITAATKATTTARRQQAVRLLELLCSVLVGADSELSADYHTSMSAVAAGSSSTVGLTRHDSGSAQLAHVLKHVREQLEVRVDYDFELSAHLLSVLQELEEVLKALVETLNAPLTTTATATAAVTTAAATSGTQTPPTSNAGGKPSGLTLSLGTATTAATTRPRAYSPVFPDPSGAPTPVPTSTAAAHRHFYASVFQLLSSSLEQFRHDSSARWQRRKQHLLAVQRQCEAELERGRRELAHYNGIVFAHKVTAFARSVEISCRFQLPASAKRVRVVAASSTAAGSSSAGGSSSSSSGGLSSFPFDASTIRKQQQQTARDKEKGPPQFQCASIDSFVDEFVSYANFLTSNRALAAKIYHTFLRFVHKKVTEDAAFAFSESKNAAASDGSGALAHATLSDRDLTLLAGAHPSVDLYALAAEIGRDEKAGSGAGGARGGGANGGGAGGAGGGGGGRQVASASVVANAHVERAVTLIERHLSTRLHAVIFPNDRSPDSFEDERLWWRLKALSWLEPRHLLIAQIPAHPKVWERALRCISRLDSFHSPRDKLACLTLAFKWLGKMLSVRCGGSSGVDADTALSALIYALVKAQPQRLCSNLAFLETYLVGDQLMGAGGYCLTQFSLAVSYISDSLGDITREQMELQLTGGGSSGSSGAGGASKQSSAGDKEQFTTISLAAAVAAATPAGAKDKQQAAIAAAAAAEKAKAAATATTTTPTTTPASPGPASTASTGSSSATGAAPPSSPAAGSATPPTLTAGSSSPSATVTAAGGKGDTVAPSSRHTRLPSVQVSASALSNALYDAQGRKRNASVMPHAYSVVVVQCLTREDAILQRVLSFLTVKELAGGRAGAGGGAGGGGGAAANRVCKKWKLMCAPRLAAAKTQAIPRLVGMNAFAADDRPSSPPPSTTPTGAKHSVSSTSRSGSSGSSGSGSGSGSSGGARASGSSFSGFVKGHHPSVVGALSHGHGTTVATNKEREQQLASAVGGIDPANDLDAILDDPVKANAFILFCKTTFCEEYLGFYLAVQSYKELANASPKQLAAAHGLYERFLKADAEQDVGISAPLRDRLTAILAAHPPDKFEREREKAKAAKAAAAAAAGAAGTAGAAAAAAPVAVVAPAAAPTPATLVAGWAAGAAAAAAAAKANNSNSSSNSNSNSNHNELALTPNTFDQVQRHVLNQMRVDIMPKFFQMLARKSGAHAGNNFTVPGTTK